jgi:hypothetical protein
MAAFMQFLPNFFLFHGGGKDQVLSLAYSYLVRVKGRISDLAASALTRNVLARMDWFSDLFSMVDIIYRPGSSVPLFMISI